MTGERLITYDGRLAIEGGLLSADGQTEERNLLVLDLSVHYYPDWVGAEILELSLLKGFLRVRLTNGLIRELRPFIPYRYIPQIKHTGPARKVTVREFVYSAFD